MRNYTQTIEFSFKTVISLITVCVLLSILIPFNQVEASDCPLLFKPDRIIINFGDNRLRSDQGEDKSIHGPINASVPAGIYDIKLVSYDDHSNHSDPAQTKEYYYVALKDSSGSLIANTPTIADLPDNLDYMNLKVATNFSIPRNVSSVTAIHPAYWDPSPNSIEAVCMAFDRVQLDPVLSIHKSVNRTTANVGDIITYALNYQNTGNGSATNVVINDPFVNLNQSHLTFMSSIPAPTGSYAWNIGTLNPGQSGTISIRARINDTIPYGFTTIKNRFNIDSSETSLTYSNYVSTSVTKNVPGTPNLVISKSVDKTSANVGDIITYVLNYQNTGNANATNVVIRDPFVNLNQLYLTFIDSNPSGFSTWNIGTLIPGQSGSITIRARISDVVPYGTTTIQDRFNIDSSETSLTYSNYVSTSVTKNVPGTPNLDIEKQVRNVFSGTSFSETVNAEKNDEVEFSLEIRSTGNTVLVNVRVWDNLPSQLDYISGTTRVDGSYKGDGIIGSGIYIGDISAGSSKIVKFKARVEDQSYSYATTLTNYGYADADNTSSVNDTARVIIEDEDEQPDLGIEKLARNITRGTSYFTKTVYAKPGDEIEFLIRLNSTGDTTVENVRVMDDLPGKLRYINGSTTVNGFYKSDGITVGSGLFIGDIYLGNVKEIKFRVNVYDADNFYSDLTTLTNNVSAWATDVDRIRDYAFVKVEKQGEVGSPALNISKSVRNISRGETSWINSTLASPSQEVEFLIEVTNTSTSYIDVTNARVWDALPAYLTYVSGSTYLDDSSTGSVLGTGLDIGTLSAGQTKKIRFKATISDIDNFGAGYTDLINTGYTSADNFSQISDTAIVRVYKPGEVKGATTVVTGANSFSLIFLALISALISFFVYCRTREDRLLEILSENGRFKWLIRFYFRMKFFVTVTKLRFEKVYW